MVKYIFNCPFTGKGNIGNGFRGQDWYDLRAKIFNENTLKSLMNQSDKDFLLWLQFRPKEKKNPTTQKIENALKKSGLEYVMTFNGIMMYDDRGTEHNKNLVERTAKSLKSIEIEAEYVYETNLDSDDMLHRDFVRIVKSEPFRNQGALYCKEGYVYEMSGRLADWYNPTANQNYTIMYPTHIYLDAKKHYEYQNGLQSHEQIPKKFDSEEMPEDMYCSLIHGTNISTKWGHQFQGKEYYYELDKQQILNNFK